MPSTDFDLLDVDSRLYSFLSANERQTFVSFVENFADCEVRISSSHDVLKALAADCETDHFVSVTGLPQPYAPADLASVVSVPPAARFLSCLLLGKVFVVMFFSHSDDHLPKQNVERLHYSARRMTSLWNELANPTSRLTHLSTFLTVVRQLHLDVAESPLRIIVSIVLRAKQMLRCDRCTVYLVDDTRRDLYSLVTDAEVDNEAQAKASSTAPAPERAPQGGSDASPSQTDVGGDTGAETVKRPVPSFVGDTGGGGGAGAACVGPTSSVWSDGTQTSVSPMLPNTPLLDASCGTPAAAAVCAAAAGTRRVSAASPNKAPSAFRAVQKVLSSAKVFRVPLGRGIAGSVAMSGCAQNIPDVYEDSRFNAAMDKMTGYRTQSMLCVPIFDSEPTVAATASGSGAGGSVSGSSEHSFTGGAIPSGSGRRVIGVLQLINKLEDSPEVVSGLVSSQESSGMGLRGPLGASAAHRKLLRGRAFDSPHACSDPEDALGDGAISPADVMLHAGSDLQIPVGSGAGELLSTADLRGKVGHSGRKTPPKKGRTVRSAAGGALSVTEFSQDDMDLCLRFGEFVSLALRNASVFNKMLLDCERAEVLLSACRSFGRIGSFLNTVGHIVNLSQRILLSQRCTLYYVDSDRTHLVSLLTDNEDGDSSRPRVIRVPMTTDSLAGAACVKEEPVCVADAYELPNFNRKFDVATGFRTKSVLCVPFFSQQGKKRQVGGVIQWINKTARPSLFAPRAVTSEDSNTGAVPPSAVPAGDGASGGTIGPEEQVTAQPIYPFDDDDLRLAISFASFVGISMTNASLVEDLTLSNARLVHLFSFVTSISSARSVSELLQHLLDSLAHCVRPKEVRVLLVHDPGAGGVDGCGHDDTGGDVHFELFSGGRTVPLNKSGGISRSVVLGLRSGSSYYSGNGRDDDLFMMGIDVPEGTEDLSSLLIVPLTAKDGTVLGVVQCINRQVPVKACYNPGRLPANDEEDQEMTVAAFTEDDVALVQSRVSAAGAYLTELLSTRDATVTVQGDVLQRMLARAQNAVSRLGKGQVELHWLSAVEVTCVGPRSHAVVLEKDPYLGRPASVELSPEVLAILMTALSERGGGSAEGTARRSLPVAGGASGAPGRASDAVPRHQIAGAPLPVSPLGSQHSSALARTFDIQAHGDMAFSPSSGSPTQGMPRSTPATKVEKADSSASVLSSLAPSALRAVADRGVADAVRTGRAWHVSPSVVVAPINDPSGQDCRLWGAIVAVRCGSVVDLLERKGSISPAGTPPAGRGVAARPADSEVARGVGGGLVPLPLEAPRLRSGQLSPDVGSRIGSGLSAAQPDGDEVACMRSPSDPQLRPMKHRTLPPMANARQPSLGEGPSGARERPLPLPGAYEGAAGVELELPVEEEEDNVNPSPAVETPSCFPAPPAASGSVALGKLRSVAISAKNLLSTTRTAVATVDSLTSIPKLQRSSGVAQCRTSARFRSLESLVTPLGSPTFEDEASASKDACASNVLSRVDHLQTFSDDEIRLMQAVVATGVAVLFRSRSHGRDRHYHTHERASSCSGPAPPYGERQPSGGGGGLSSAGSAALVAPSTTASAGNMRQEGSVMSVCRRRGCDGTSPVNDRRLRLMGFMQREEAAMTFGLTILRRRLTRATASNVASGAETPAGPLVWKQGDFIGSGGHGSAFTAQDQRTGKIIAVKMIDFNPGEFPDQRAIMQLQTEIQTMRNLKHKNIVQYLASERRGPTVCILMEYVPGGSIAQLLSSAGPFSESVIGSYLLHALTGLQFLHSQHIVHGDIKGANLLIATDGTVKLADFGSVRVLDRFEASTHAAGAAGPALGGTPAWMAPEAVSHEFGKVGTSSDIWSVGCIVMEMYTAKPPWSHQLGVSNPSAAAIMALITDKNTELTFPPDWPADVVAFVSQCCQRDQAARPTAEQLLQHPLVVKAVGSETASNERVREGGSVDVWCGVLVCGQIVWRALRFLIWGCAARFVWLQLAFFEVIPPCMSNPALQFTFVVHFSCGLSCVHFGRVVSGIETMLVQMFGVGVRSVQLVLIVVFPHRYAQVALTSWQEA